MKVSEFKSDGIKVFMICGMLCSGKTVYSESLKAKKNAVVLSVDEAMLLLFGRDAGDRHEYYAEKVKYYLYRKSLEIIETGTSVILDWGFWTEKERSYTRNFYKSRNIECELHFISISHDEWIKRIDKRNREVLENNTDAYYVDAGLKGKFEKIFEKPDKSEVDVYIKQ